MDTEGGQTQALLVISGPRETGFEPHLPCHPTLSQGCFFYLYLIAFLYFLKGFFFQFKGFYLFICVFLHFLQ